MDGRLAKNARGFTLIELMITVAIVGILASLAYPSYQAYLVKGRRADAQAQLLLIAQREELYLLDARAYTSDVLALRVSLPASVSAFYSIAITAPVGATPPTFLIVATPIPGTAQANDLPLTLNSAGAKSPINFW